MNSVLTFSPTFVGKSYCRDRWVDAYRSQSVPSDLVIVDDSPVAPRPGGATESVMAAWSTIPEHARYYRWVWSLEADVIPAPDVLQRLLFIAQPGATRVADMVAAVYPQRKQPGTLCALGCTLMTGELASRIGQQIRDRWTPPEATAESLAEARVVATGLGLQHIDGE